MTPTLMGRWQTRLLLLSTVGLAVALTFGRLYEDFITPLALLGYVLMLGFLWDILYQAVQSLRWDRDWPPSFQLAAGIIEGAFLWALIALWHSNAWFGWHTLSGVDAHLTFVMYLAHYSTVWLTTFLTSQSTLRIIFPRWRFCGGKWM